MSRLNEEVLSAFVEGKTEFPKGNSLEIVGNELRWFKFNVVVAIRLDGLVLINGDRMSAAFGGGNHNIDLARRLNKQEAKQEHVIIPFSALRAANINPRDLQKKSFLDQQQATEFYVFSDDKVNWENTAGPVDTSQGTVTEAVEWGSSSKYKYRGYYHKLGGALFTYNGEKYLSGIDEGSYFLSQLPQDCPAATIAQAFAALMPEEVKGKEYVRQGEWFFVSISNEEIVARYPELTLSRLERLSRVHALPIRDRRSNRHMVKLYQTKRSILCRGWVRHYEDSWLGGTENQAEMDVHGKLSNQHRSLNLNGWHLAYRNTEQNSWSAEGGGRVD